MTETSPPRDAVQRRMRALMMASMIVQAAALLSACGGGADSTSPPPPAPPPSPAACGAATGVTVQHNANISASETWAGDGVTHSVPSSISIRGAAVVTIEPCAIVAMGAGASITVNDTAKLVAAGAGATRFVTFRRANAAQPWGTLRGVSETSLIDLRHATLQGGGSFGGQYRNPAITIVGAGYAATPLPTLKVDNVTIDSPVGAGIYIDTNGAFTPDSQALTIRNAGDYPIVTTIMSLGSIPTGSYTGNARDEIFIVGSPNVFADLTIPNRGVPVRIQTGGMSIAATGTNTNIVTLTVEKGVTVRFPKASPTTPGARVIFGSNGNSPNNRVGVLRALGTAAEPIRFLSGEDAPAPGDWAGLWLNTANGSKLDYVEIAHAGADNGISSVNCKPTNTTDNGALIVGDFQDQYVPPADLITNSTIRDSAGHGINAIWPNVSFASPNLTASNTITNYVGCRQTYNAVTPPGTCPALLGCTVN